MLWAEKWVYNSESNIFLGKMSEPQERPENRLLGNIRFSSKFGFLPLGVYISLFLLGSPSVRVGVGVCGCATLD